MNDLIVELTDALEQYHWHYDHARGAPICQECQCNIDSHSPDCEVIRLIRRARYYVDHHTCYREA